MYNVTLIRSCFEYLFDQSVIDYRDELSIYDHDFVINKDYNHIDKQRTVYSKYVKHVCWSKQFFYHRRNYMHREKYVIIFIIPSEKSIVEAIIF